MSAEKPIQYFVTLKPLPDSRDQNGDLEQNEGYLLQPRPFDPGLNHDMNIGRIYKPFGNGHDNRDHHADETQEVQ